MLFSGAVVTFGKAVTAIVENLFPNRRALVGSVLAWVRREEYTITTIQRLLSWWKKKKKKKNSFTWHTRDRRRGETIELSHVMGIMLFKFGEMCFRQSGRDMYPLFPALQQTSVIPFHWTRPTAKTLPCHLSVSLLFNEFTPKTNSLVLNLLRSSEKLAYTPLDKCVCVSRVPNLIIHIRI